MVYINMLANGGLLVLVLISQLSADTDMYRGFRQLNSNMSCCGGDDCAALQDGAVKAVKGGYMVESFGFIPNNKAQPGPDQHYHLCHAGPTVYCFLTPNPGV